MRESKYSRLSFATIIVLFLANILNAQEVISNDQLMELNYAMHKSEQMYSWAIDIIAVFIAALTLFVALAGFYNYQTIKDFKSETKKYKKEISKQANDFIGLYDAQKEDFIKFIDLSSAKFNEQQNELNQALKEVSQYRDRIQVTQHLLNLTRDMIVVSIKDVIRSLQLVLSTLPDNTRNDLYQRIINRLDEFNAVLRMYNLDNDLSDAESAILHLKENGTKVVVPQLEKLLEILTKQCEFDLDLKARLAEFNILYQIQELIILIRNK